MSRTAQQSTQQSDPQFTQHSAPPAETSRTIVALHAHPDDEAIFTGLTLRALADAGHRVVLVCATAGEAGIARTTLARRESLAARRLAELERASEILGVQRLVVLPFRDSGAHQGPYRRGTLGATPAAEVATKLRTVVEEENARAIVHYDPHGIYSHIDHLQVHRAGRRVSRDLHLTAYEATVDAARVLVGPRHVLHAAATDWSRVGSRPDQVSLTVSSRPNTLLAKMAALAGYASQIRPEFLEAATFTESYGQEWFIRHGARTVIDDLAHAATDPSLPLYDHAPEPHVRAVGR